LFEKLTKLEAERPRIDKEIRKSDTELLNLYNQLEQSKILGHSEEIAAAANAYYGLRQRRSFLKDDNRFKIDKCRSRLENLANPIVAKYHASLTTKINELQGMGSVIVTSETTKFVPNFQGTGHDRDIKFVLYRSNILAIKECQKALIAGRQKIGGMKTNSPLSAIKSLYDALMKSIDELNDGVMANYELPSTTFEDWMSNLPSTIETNWGHFKTIKRDQFTDRLERLNDIGRKADRN
jgi:hypothetical protein